MNRAMRIIVPVLFLSLTWQVASALLRDRFGDEAFEAAHVVPGFVLAGLVLVHLALNWRWLRGYYRPKPKAPQPGTRKAGLGSGGAE